MKKRLLNFGKKVSCFAYPFTIIHFPAWRVAMVMAVYVPDGITCWCQKGKFKPITKELWLNILISLVAS